MMRHPLVLTAAIAATSLLLHPSVAPDVTMTPVADATELAAPVAPDLLAAPVTPPIAPVAPAPAPAPAPPPEEKGVLPFGSGMWIWLPDQVEGGDVAAIVAKAQAYGLTHLYVKTGLSWEGMINRDFITALLPAAHAVGLRVYGWDFPAFIDVNVDLTRAVQAIQYMTPDGQRLDGFSPDIETESEGVLLSAEAASAYANGLRANVGPRYPLIATVPRPSDYTIAFYPYAEVIGPMDAVAPMVYWLNRDPANDVAQALADLAPLGKPVLPIGQAYDGGPEGGPKGPPPKEALVRFMNTALDKGALGVSFWVWNQATPEHWAAIDEAHAWELPTGDPSSPAAVRYLQRVISTFGRPVAQDGVLGAQTRSALAAVQQSLGLPGTGKLDRPTISSLVGPR